MSWSTTVVCIQVAAGSHAAHVVPLHVDEQHGNNRHDDAYHHSHTAADKGVPPTRYFFSAF